MWLAPRPGGETVVVVFDAEDPGSILRRLAESGEPFDVWLRDSLTELHGLDLRRPNPGGLWGYAPELIYTRAPNPAVPTAEEEHA